MASIGLVPLGLIGLGWVQGLLGLRQQRQRGELALSNPVERSQAPQRAAE